MKTENLDMGLQNILNEHEELKLLLELGDNLLDFYDKVSKIKDSYTLKKSRRYIIKPTEETVKGYLDIINKINNELNERYGKLNKKYEEIKGRISERLNE